MTICNNSLAINRYFTNKKVHLQGYPKISSLAISFIPAKYQDQHKSITLPNSNATCLSFSKERDMRMMLSPSLASS